MLCCSCLQHLKAPCSSTLNLGDGHVQADLAAKYQLVFQSYGRDLEAVQALYEKHKMAPPLPRNAPPVAGNIQWSRQLLRRIETPMKRCVAVCLVLACLPVTRAPQIQLLSFGGRLCTHASLQL